MEQRFGSSEDKCVICSGTGHLARDCTEPRVDRFACRNCGCVKVVHRAV